MRIVIALGGNAMTAADGRARVEDQQAAIAQAAGPIADLVAAGHAVLITHGNGPQVGNLLVKNELAASVVPPVPLDWCGAQTQATLGFVLMNALESALADRGVERRTAALVTRARLYIGGDSGPLHIAATTRTPIVALFGPTLPQRSLPWRDPASAPRAVSISWAR